MSRYSNHTCDRCGLMYSQLGKAHSACPQCVIHKVEDLIEAVDEIAPDKLEKALVSVVEILNDYHYKPELDSVKHWHEGFSETNPCCDLKTGVPNKKIIEKKYEGLGRAPEKASKEN